MLRSTASTLVPPGTTVALDQWIATLGDRDYQRTSKAHVGLARTRDGVLLTVEQFPLAIILNRHDVVEISARSLSLESPHSFAYVFGLFRISLRVRWSMALDGVPPPAMISGTLELEFRRPWLERLARLFGLGRLLAAHAREELDGFAADIGRKAQNHDTAVCPADAGTVSRSHGRG